MDNQAVFAHLKKQKKAVLLDYLHAAFQEMDAEQRQAARQPGTTAVDGVQLQTAERNLAGR